MINDQGTEVTGTVTSVSVQNKSVYLEMDTGDEVPLQNVETISPATTALASAAASPDASALAAVLPQLQQMLGNNSSNSSGVASILSMLTGK